MYDLISKLRNNKLKKFIERYEGLCDLKLSRNENVLLLFFFGWNWIV